MFINCKGSPPAVQNDNTYKVRITYMSMYMYMYIVGSLIITAHVVE